MFGRSLQLTLALLLSFVLVAGCAAGKEESAYLAQPRVGDLYAVELSQVMPERSPCRSLRALCGFGQPAFSVTKTT